MLPVPGSPERGLYDHKVSLGAVWTESAPAHLAVLRPGWVAVGDGLARVRRLAKRG